MPVKILIAAFLILIGFIIQAISVIKENRSDKEVGSDITLVPTETTVETIKSQKKNKKVVRYLLLLLLFLSFLLSTWILWDQHKEDIRNEKKHTSEVDTTWNMLKTGIKKSSLLLDSLQTVQIKIRGMSDTMAQQLHTQKEINSSTQLLLRKNETILTSQSAIRGNVDHILNPFFPLMVSVEFEIPFSAPQIKPLTDYFTKYKAKLDSHDPSIDDEGAMIDISKPGEADKSIVAIDLIDYDKRVENKIPFDSVVDVSWGMRIAKGPLKTFNDITDNTPKLIVEIDGSNKAKYRKISLGVSFESQTFRFYIVYYGLQLYNNFHHRSEVFIGTNDLLHSYLFLQPNYQWQKNGLQVDRLTFISEIGLQNECTIKFSEKDIINSYPEHKKFNEKFPHFLGLKNRIYVHKIGKEDLSNYRIPKPWNFKIPKKQPDSVMKKILKGIY
ncbi:MAG: hypothetical protein JWQ09_5992 [Segetibacter sp.]|nr:hypothetical protein [Segetibacter sp.]